MEVRNAEPTAIADVVGDVGQRTRAIAHGESHDNAEQRAEQVSPTNPVAFGGSASRTAEGRVPSRLQGAFVADGSGFHALVNRRRTIGDHREGQEEREEELAKTVGYSILLVGEVVPVRTASVSVNLQVENIMHL